MRMLYSGKVAIKATVGAAGALLVFFFNLLVVTSPGFSLDKQWWPVFGVLLGAYQLYRMLHCLRVTVPRIQHMEIRLIRREYRRALRQEIRRLRFLIEATPEITDVDELEAL